jgi:hypothetical protein
VRARRLERAPALGREDLLVRLVGKLRVGDRRLAAQCLGLVAADLVESLVDLGVDPADEERRNAAEPGDVLAGHVRALDTFEERVHDGLVALETEDQRDVDADALGEELADGGQPLDRGRHLDEEVRPVDQPPQRAGLGDGLGGVVRDARVDLDRHATVDAVRGVVDGPQHVARPAHVVGGDRPQRLADVDAADRQVAKLVVVEVAAVTAFWKIVGFVVMPASDSSRMRRSRSPVSSRSRLRSSSHTATPSAESLRRFSVPMSGSPR